MFEGAEIERTTEEPGVNTERAGVRAITRSVRKVCVCFGGEFALMVGWH